MLRDLLLATLFMWVARGIICAQCVPPEWFPKTETFSAIPDIQIYRGKAPPVANCIWKTRANESLRP
jgi:hypothetical protein